MTKVWRGTDTPKRRPQMHIVGVTRLLRMPLRKSPTAAIAVVYEGRYDMHGMTSYRSIPCLLGVDTTG